ncbi:MAG: Ycf66 family protein [Synechococcales bacterium]|nr:Ycf66 family protein [Synechococcales bacterium]
MINFGSNPAFILGIALALCGVALYAMRSYRPELSRDHDIFFAAIALITGLILMFQGWRLDPLLLLGQLSLAGSAVFFAVENIRLRGVTTQQAKRNTPIVDDDRPVSRNYRYDNYEYRAEFEELPSVEDRAESRRIRASRDPRSARRDDYADSRRSAYGGNRRDEGGYGPDDRPASKRRLPRPQRRYPERDDIVEPTWDDVGRRNPDADWGDRPARSRSRDEYREDYREDYRENYVAPPAEREPVDEPAYPRRSAPEQQYPARPASSTGDYTEYRPADYTNDEADNSSYQDEYPY